MVADFIEAGAFFSFFSSLLYIAGYTLLAPWWRNPVGRGMVSFSAATVVLLLPATLHFAFGITTANTFFGWYYFSSLVLSGIIELWRLQMVYRIQQHDTPYRSRRKKT
jgi:hypothetical protein